MTTKPSKLVDQLSLADGIPETPPAQPYPRPRPRTQKTLGLLDALSPLTPLQDDGTPTAAGSLVNVGSGIPDDESDTEERAAAKSSPIKAGKRVTSAVCDFNTLTYFSMLTVINRELLLFAQHPKPAQASLYTNQFLR